MKNIHNETKKDNYTISPLGKIRSTLSKNNHRLAIRLVTLLLAGSTSFLTMKHCSSVKEKASQELIDNVKEKFPNLSSEKKDSLKKASIINEPEGQTEIANPYIEMNKLKSIINIQDLQTRKELYHIDKQIFADNFVDNKIGESEYLALTSQEKGNYTDETNHTYRDFVYLHQKSREYLMNLKKRFNEDLQKTGYNKEVTFKINSLARSLKAQKKAGTNATTSTSMHSVGIAIDIKYDYVKDLPVLYYKNNKNQWEEVTNAEVTQVAGKMLIELLNADSHTSKIFMTKEKNNNCLHIVTNVYGDKPFEEYRKIYKEEQKQKKIEMEKIQEKKKRNQQNKKTGEEGKKKHSKKNEITRSTKAKKENYTIKKTKKSERKNLKNKKKKPKR